MAVTGCLGPNTASGEAQGCTRTLGHTFHHHTGETGLIPYCPVAREKS